MTAISLQEFIADVMDDKKSCSAIKINPAKPFLWTFYSRMDADFVEAVKQKTNEDIPGAFDPRACGKIIPRAFRTVLVYNPAHEVEDLYFIEVETTGFIYLGPYSTEGLPIFLFRPDILHRVLPMCVVLEAVRSSHIHAQLYPIPAYSSADRNRYITHGFARELCMTYKCSHAKESRFSFPIDRCHVFAEYAKMKTDRRINIGELLEGINLLQITSAIGIWFLYQLENHRLTVDEDKPSGGINPIIDVLFSIVDNKTRPPARRNIYKQGLLTAMGILAPSSQEPDINVLYYFNIATPMSCSGLFFVEDIKKPLEAVYSLKRGSSTAIPGAVVNVIAALKDGRIQPHITHRHDKHGELINLLLLQQIDLLLAGSQSKQVFFMDSTYFRSLMFKADKKAMFEMADCVVILHATKLIPCELDYLLTNNPRAIFVPFVQTSSHYFLGRCVYYNICKNVSYNTIEGEMLDPPVWKDSIDKHFTAAILFHPEPIAKKRKPNDDDEYD